MLRTFTSTIALAALFAFGASAAHAGDKCTIATKGDSDVAKACAAGGIKDAKKVMKKMVTTAKDKGKKFECDSCHKNEDDWKLTDDAQSKFKDLLAAQK